jgi:hypothetical protein
MSRGKIVWWLFWWLFASRDLHFGRKLSDASIHAGQHCSISQLSRPTYSRLSPETRPRGLQLSRLINDLCRSSAEVFVIHSGKPFVQRSLALSGLTAWVRKGAGHSQEKCCEKRPPGLFVARSRLLATYSVDSTASAVFSQLVDSHSAHECRYVVFPEIGVGHG